MVLVTVFENGWGPDELIAKLGRVLDLNEQRNGLESQLVNILAAAIQAVNGEWAMAGSLVLLACLYRGSNAWAGVFWHNARPSQPRGSRRSFRRQSLGGLQ
jgi:hypothetical protein